MSRKVWRTRRPMNKWRAKEYYFNGDEMESFVLRFENLFSRESLFALKQTNMTGFFSKVDQMY